MTPSDYTGAQWAQIVSILKTEAASGRLKNVNWTNQSGSAQTSTMNDVRKSLHLYTGNVPACGVQLSKYAVNKYSTANRLLTAEFTIIVSVQANGYTDGSGNAVPANGDDALAEAWAFIADGTGNGMSEIFRDPNNRTLNNTCTEQFLSAGVPVLSIGDGQTPQVWADIYLTLTVKSELSIHN